MTERRLPIGVLAIVPVVIGLGLYAFTGQAQVTDPAADATAIAAAEASLTPAATPTWFPDSPPQWTPEPQPTPWTPQTSHGVFHDGAWVRVNAGAGDCLNARNSPSLANEYVIVNICVPDGYEGAIAGHTTEADGHWWWYLAGLGYVAEEYLSFLGEFDPQTHTVPMASADHSNVAFLRGGDIWLMRPDGSDQRRVVDRPDDDPHANTFEPRPQNMTWSPDGTMLSYNIHDWREPQPDGRVDLHLVSFTGDDVAEQVFAGLAGGGWSPDGARLGIVREAKPAQMSDGVMGIAGVLEVATGGQLVLSSEQAYHQKAPSFNHDGTLLMVSFPSTLIIYAADGTEFRRIEFPSPTGYASPSWSPVANNIAIHHQDSGAARYRVYSVDEARFIAESETPKYSDRVGGGCGGGDMWETEWSGDGRRVLYSFMFGDTGANGIWSWEIETGDRHVIPAANAGSASAGAGPAVMFAAAGSGEPYIFIGSTDGGLPQIVTEGAQPVWYAGP